MIFDRYALGFSGVRVHLLDPYQWAGPDSDRNRAKLGDALGPLVLYHMWGKGSADKKGRLRARGYWFLDGMGLSLPPPAMAVA